MKKILIAFSRWFDSGIDPETPAAGGTGLKTVDWVRCLPFVLMHAACLAVLWVGASPVALMTAAALYFLRMFAITGFYHRYFSHRTFSTSRLAQFMFALAGASSVQRGPLWWAAHHRRHHLHSDLDGDLHSPKRHGFWWSHMGWITSRENFSTDFRRIPDLAKYPELVFLNRFDILVPILLGSALYASGVWLSFSHPQLRTTGGQMLVWGFFVSTMVLFHATCTINSLAHVFGRRRFETGDDSKNNLALSIITLGEGWHNNHHYYQSAARQGFFWWELDVTYYLLKLLSWCGIIWDLHAVPAHVLQNQRSNSWRN